MTKVDGSSENHAQDQISLQSRVRGCLLGGAIGDALGAPVEFIVSAGEKRPQKRRF